MKTPGWIAVLLLASVNVSLPLQAQAPAGPSPAQASRLTLDELIAEAERANPELRATTQELRAARARVRPAGALPDPMIEFGQMNVGNIVPFTTLGQEEMSEVYVGFRQDFPFFGKRTLRTRVAEKEAGAESWGVAFTRWRVLAELKRAYYDLFFWYQTLETLGKNMDLLEKFSQTAAALYQVGKGTQADVLRAQTEMSLLQQRIELAEQRKGIAEAEINALLNRAPDTPLARPAPVEPVPLAYPFGELLRLADEKYPLLRRQSELIASNQFAVQLAQREKYPDFGVVFGYHNRGGLPDRWSIGGTMRIPLYFGRKQKQEIEEADARLAAAEERYSSLRAQLALAVKDHYLSATTSERLQRLFAKTIIPQETLTLEATAASYEVGAVDFLSVIDSLIKLLEDELSYYEHVTNYQKALAALEPLVGVELTR